ncbi:hypothetical protein HYR54_10080 [Candidatus Acetothermia bacterium]|nr:hypothetical protein [Candidatus Acetothermia bacterium]
MCCGNNEEKKLETAQASEQEEPQNALSRRTLIKTVSAGAIALGLAAGTEHTTQAHDAPGTTPPNGCPQISRLSWNLRAVEPFEWKCTPCKCNQQTNYVSFWNFRAPIGLDLPCDEGVIPDGSLFVASVKVVWTFNDCGGAAAVVKKVVGRYEGRFDIVSSTGVKLISGGEIVGTWGFDTDFSSKDRCCAFPHDEGCLRARFTRKVVIAGTNKTTTVNCVLHATLSSLCDVADLQFCELGPKAWHAQVNGTVECRCVQSSTQPQSEEELKVSKWQATPNPAKSSSPITFNAQGQGVAGIQVAVLSLAGVKLFESGEVLGNSFTWDGIDLSGRPLANGVYLYEVIAKGSDDRTVRSTLQKLVIKR